MRKPSRHPLQTQSRPARLRRTVEAEKLVAAFGIEGERSKMEVMPALKSSGFARGVGPGVYDIHSPRVPSVEEVTELLGTALGSIPQSQVWVNPDCGLKIRGHDETVASLENMLAATRAVRETVASAG